MLTLYNFPPSVCSIKVRLGLAEMELPYEEKIVSLPKGEHLAPEYTKLNPSAVVPTLVDDGHVVVESSLIIEYLDKHFNDSKLMPQDKMDETTVRYWLLRTLTIHLAINTLTFSTAYRDRILKNATVDEAMAEMEGTPDPIYLLKRRDLLEHGLSSIHLTQALGQMRRAINEAEAALARNPYLSGARYGLADLALTSYFDRIERLGFEGLWGGEDAPLGRWLEEMQDRSSYKNEVIDVLNADDAKKLREEGGRYWGKLELLWST